MHIDYKRLSMLVLPISLRKPVVMALVNHFIAPMKYIYSQFLTFKEEKEYRMSHNGQVCLLEKILNEKLLGLTDSYLIHIYDAKEFMNMEIPFYKDIPEHQRYICYDSESIGDITDENSLLYDNSISVSPNMIFEVRLDSSLAKNAGTIQRMRYENNGGDRMLVQLLDTYKLAGKQYQIIYEV